MDFFTLKYWLSVSDFFVFIPITLDITDLHRPTTMGDKCLVIFSYESQSSYHYNHLVASVQQYDSPIQSSIWIPISKFQYANNNLSFSPI